MGVLFMTGFTIYTILDNQAKMLQEKNNFYADYFVLKKALKDDFNRTGTVTISEDGRQLKIQPTAPYERNNEPVYYIFDTSFVVRFAGDALDTLPPGAQIESFRLAGDSTDLVGFVKLHSQYKGKSFFTYLQKKYSAEEIFSAGKPEQ
ncbi:hypothetical protein [Niabella aquatica]